MTNAVELISRIEVLERDVEVIKRLLKAQGVTAVEYRQERANVEKDWAVDG